MKTFFPFTIEHDSLVLLYKTNLIYVAQSKILNLWKINNLICSSTVWWWKWNGLNQSNHCFVATNLLFQYVLTENERYDLWNLHFEFVFEWYFVTGEGLEKDNERMKINCFHFGLPSIFAFISEKWHIKTIWIQFIGLSIFILIQCNNNIIRKLKLNHGRL